MSKWTEQGLTFITARFPEAKREGFRKALREEFGEIAEDAAPIRPAAYLLREKDGDQEVVCFEILGSADPLDRKLLHYIDLWWWADNLSAWLTLYVVEARSGAFTEIDLTKAAWDHITQTAGTN